MSQHREKYGNFTEFSADRGNKYLENSDCKVMPGLLSLFEHPGLWAQAAAAKTASTNNITKARFAGLYALKCWSLGEDATKGGETSQPTKSRWEILFYSPNLCLEA